MADHMFTALLKSLGFNPAEMQAQATAALELIKSIDARLSLLAQQQQLIIAMLTVERSGDGDVQRVMNGTRQLEAIASDVDT
jgi:hypothetical protein